MRPGRDPADVLRSIGRRKARAARRWAPEESFASTDPDPRTELPLDRRDAVVETLRDGTVLVTYMDAPLRDASLAANEPAPDAPSRPDEEWPIMPLPPPPAAQDDRAAELAARWKRFSHGG